jgi:chaperonin GroES
VFKLSVHFSKILRTVHFGNCGEVYLDALAANAYIQLKQIPQDILFTKIQIRRSVMKIRPLGDRVLVRMVEGESKTAGGIYIPQTAQEKTQEGVVLAVGDDEEINVKVKDRVIYDKYAGSTIKVEGEEQLILKVADILAVIE